MRKQDFSSVYAEFKETVWKLVSRYVPSKHDREDLFQEVFLKVHGALPKFRGDSSLKSWIYSITANTSINYLKKQSRYKKLKDVLAGFGIIPHEEKIEEGERALEKHLSKLNPRQRMVLLLSDVEEKKLEEISSIMGMPVGTVKSNLHRAREIVKKELMDDERL